MYVLKLSGIQTGNYNTIIFLFWIVLIFSLIIFTKGWGGKKLNKQRKDYREENVIKICKKTYTYKIKNKKR